MDRIRIQARELRHNPTDAECALWQQLRFWQIDGYKFRRQQPLGKYVVDFICFEKRLVIEVDGGQHAEQEKEYDSQRDAWLVAEGFSVLRFWNDEVLKNIDGVKEVILNKLQNTPFLSFSPQGEGKNLGDQAPQISSKR